MLEKENLCLTARYIKLLILKLHKIITGIISMSIKSSAGENDLTNSLFQCHSRTLISFKRRVSFLNNVVVI